MSGYLQKIIFPVRSDIYMQMKQCILTSRSCIIQLRKPINQVILSVSHTFRLRFFISLICNERNEMNEPLIAVILISPSSQVPTRWFAPGYVKKANSSLWSSCRVS